MRMIPEHLALPPVEAETPGAAAPCAPATERGRGQAEVNTSLYSLKC